MTCKRRIIRLSNKEGNITQRQAKEIVETIRDRYLKIRRVGEMELRIHIDVKKMDNGFILSKDIYGIKSLNFAPEDGREVFLRFPDVRARIIELLKKISGELEEAITETILRKK